MKELRLIIAVLLLAVGLCTISYVPMTDWGYSLVMVLHFLCVLGLVWSTRRLTPFFLFMATFVFLFIGGRFWVILFDPEFDILTRGNFFYYQSFSPEGWKMTLRFVLTFLYSAVIGYNIVSREGEQTPTLPLEMSREKQQLFSIFLSMAICIVAVTTFMNVIPKLLTAIQGGGYLSLYNAAQNSQSQAGGGVFYALLWVFLGIIMVYGNHRQRLVMLIIVGLRMLILAYIGQRGGLGCFLLFCIWYKLKDRDIRLAPLMVIAAICLGLVWLISYLSLRSYVAGLEKGKNVIADLFFSQGVSLTAFYDSTLIDKYPTLAYWADIFPGVGSLANWFSSEPIHHYHYNFTHFMAYTLNEPLYSEGYALGWTLLSDLYVFAHGHILLFAFLSCLFGLLCGAVERGCQSSTICQIIVYTCFIHFVFLPRAGLESIIPLIIWIIFIFGIVAMTFHLSIRIKKLKTKST